MTSIVSDTAEAVDLCPEYNLYLKPIAKITVSVALPHLKTPGKSISNWEVMERLKSMVQPEQFSSLRISKSTMDFIRFEGEVENKSAVKRVLTKLDGKSIKLSGFTDILKIRAVENKADFPTRHDWDSFFRDAKDMNETVPGERPDTVHLEGLPCKWFSPKDGVPDRPSETVLRTVFQRFGKIRNVDIPMLDPYREEMTGKNFNTFSFACSDSCKPEVLGCLLTAERVFSQVTFDTTKHLSDSSLKKQQKLKEKEEKKTQKKLKKQQEEEQKKLQLKIAMEERKLLLAQRNLESIRLIAELLSRAKRLKQQQVEQQQVELARLQQLEERRRQQEDELRRVEAEKARALELQRKERELRDRLLGNLLKKSTNTDENVAAPLVHVDLQICGAQAQLNGVTLPTENPDKETSNSKKQEERTDGDRRDRTRRRSGGRRRSRSRGRGGRRRSGSRTRGSRGRRGRKYSQSSSKSRSSSRSQRGSSSRSRSSSRGRRRRSRHRSRRY
ncbi:A-kinase anchor protein 17A [Labeo rohita]|uniref:A-kinase anchor protein 17A n=1 Tax=Labeo rohita TaxID=84645 RepID=A0ABQ8MEI5_LABRO|nr:A-kinase anchor protein 17A [Labeo rohita]